jgi:hypothetical protein
MGGVTSGVRGWRGGKASIASLPVVRITHADTWTVKRRSVYVLIDGPDRGTVVCGMRQWPVDIATTRLHFGGQRRWLCCPDCGARRLALYVNDKHLACRVCLGLRYESQHENKRQRAFRAADRVREALGWKPGILNPIGSKPWGMHWSTFQRLTDELDARTDAVLCGLPEWIDRAERGIERRRARTHF